VELINPLYALKKAREVIDGNIISGQPKTLILDQLQQFHIFTDRIIKAKFGPVAGQLDFMPWPPAKQQPNVTIFTPPRSEKDSDSFGYGQRG